MKIKLLKYLGALLVAALGTFLFVVYLSAVETRLLCSGEISHRGDSQKAVLYMKLREYRWWVGLWSKSDADVTLEVQNKPLVEVYWRVFKNGDLLNIYDYPGHPVGYFSTLSKTLAITTSAWSFDGICKNV